jgi:hypothetical protein
MPSSSGLAPTPACIDGSAARRLQAITAHRIVRRLSPGERAILRLSYSFPLVRSPTLALTFSRITARVLPSLARRVQALALGMRVVEQRARQALSLGYYQALEWLKDISYGALAPQRTESVLARDHVNTRQKLLILRKRLSSRRHGKSDGNPSKPITCCIPSGACGC